MARGRRVVPQVRVVKAELADQDAQRMRHTEASAEEEWLLPARPSYQDQSALSREDLALP